MCATILGIRPPTITRGRSRPVIEMYTAQQKAQCVLWYAKSDSITEVNDKFVDRYGGRVPAPTNIRY